MKFIHAADLHIDSSLRGLEAYEGAPLEQLRGATRTAFQNLVTLAVEQAVDFVIIAGDLFDGTWQDMRTGLWTAARFRQLQQANIPVYLLQGNHDAASKVRQAIRWPENVHVFSVKQPQTIRLDDHGVALHGQGFAQGKITQDLAADYPPPVARCFNIGVLHTSLTGSDQHDTYAPTTLATLQARGYDYWALGHIHARSQPALSDVPYIAYSGNLQGRHIREPGAKGCLLVTVRQQELAEVQFVATDCVRWQTVEVRLQTRDGRDELLDAIRQQLAQARDKAEGRLVAARLQISGACDVHRELVRELDRAEIIAEIRNIANESDGQIWIEKIRFSTTAPVQLESWLESKDLLGTLLRSLRAARDDPQRLSQLASCLEPLRTKGAAELAGAGVELNDPEQLLEWLDAAEALLVARLTESDG